MLANLHKTVLYELGMPDMYLNPTKCTRKTIKDLQTKLNSRCEQNWHQEVSPINLDKSTNEDSNKLQTYQTFKTNFQQEKYLLLKTKCTRKTIKDLQTKLKSRYIQKWHQEVSPINLDKSTNEDSNKLQTYQTFKTNFQQEKYLLLKTFEHRFFCHSLE